MGSFPVNAHPMYGGMRMNSQEYWQLFMETGAPEAYLLFNNARKMELDHVLDNSRPGTSGHSLQ